MSDERRRRTLGDDARCNDCGWNDVAALQRDRDGTIICYECARARDGKSTTEKHHPIGRALTETIPIPGNLHRCLSARQANWPKAARDDPKGDPLKTIACVCCAVADFARFAPAADGTPARRCMDWFAAHADRFARWLLLLHAKLSTALGATWWRALGLPDLFPSNGE